MDILRANPDYARASMKKVVVACSWLAIIVSVGLACWQLGRMGLSLDEWSDYDIARSYVKSGGFLGNKSDPTQGRFNHLVAALSFALFGFSYVAFKAPFVLSGVLGGFGVWRLLRKHVSPEVALLFTALYGSMPYVLAASRTAATAGDVLVMAFTVAFIATLDTWEASGAFWFSGALCATACGVATGTKWTCGLLGICALGRHLAVAYRRRTLSEGSTWTELCAFPSIAAACAVIASPTFLLGYPFIVDSLKGVAAFERVSMYEFGAFRPAAPWYYVPAVLVSKMSPLLIPLALSGIGLALTNRLRHRDRGLVIVCLLSLAPMVPLALKPFQNAQYYIGAVPALLVCSALAFHHFLEGASRKVDIALHCGGLLVLGSQLGLSIWLAPDFLQAGRQFGRLFQGQFMGPAVNHCQGGPFAIAAVNELTARKPAPVFHLTTCVEALAKDATDGPIKPKLPIRAYPGRDRPGLPHYVLVSSMYDYVPQNLHQRQEKRKHDALQGCSVAKRGVEFAIYYCQ